MQRNVAIPLGNPPQPKRGDFTTLMIPIICIILVACLAPEATGQTPQPVPTTATVTTWSVVGPFPNVGGSQISTSTIVEESDDTTSTFENMWGGQSRWQTYHATDLLGWVNLTNHAPTPSCMFVARTFVSSPVEQRVHLRVGLIGAARVYLNDSLILAIDDDVFASSTSITVACNLSRGWNKLHVRIGRDVMPLLSFMISPLDQSGNPLANLQFSTQPQKITRVSPNAVVVDRRRSEIDTLFQRNPEIIATLRNVAEADTSGVRVMSQRAWEAYQRGDTALSARYCARIHDVVQEHAATWHLRALLHRSAGRMDSATVCIERALTHDPGFLAAWKSAFEFGIRTNPLTSISTINVDSLAEAALSEPIVDTTAIETIVMDIHHAFLFGSTTLKRVQAVFRIHRAESTAPLPLPEQRTTDALAMQSLTIFSLGNKPRVVNLADSSSSLDNVGPGDVIVYRAERFVRDSSFPRFGNAKLGFSTFGPVRRARICFSVPLTDYYQSRLHNFSPDYSEAEVGNSMVYTWEARNLAAIRPEPFMPPAQDFMPSVEVGTCSSWLTIINHVKAAFSRRMQSCDELKATVDRLLPTDGKWSRETAIQTITRWAIDSIALIPSQGLAIAPQRACDVLALRSGTLVDKVILVSTMLAERNVQAIPTLVNTESSVYSADPVPSFPFDHIILLFPGDSTLALCDLSVRSMPFRIAPRNLEERFALPIDPRLRDAGRLFRRYFGKRSFHTTTRLTFEGDSVSRSAITIQASDLDSAAIRILQQTFSQPMGEDQGAARMYDTAWIAPTKGQPSTPTLHLTARHSVMADSAGDTITIRPRWMSMPSYPMMPYEQETRSFPLDLQTNHDSVTADITITAPKGYVFVKPLPSTTITLPAMSYSLTATLKGSTLRLRRTVAQRASSIVPADYPAFRRAHREMLLMDTSVLRLVRKRGSSRR